MADAIINSAPLVRMPSSSSLMSIDCTPQKTPGSVARRRLASKSMHNLAAAASNQSCSAHGGTPDRENDDNQCSPIEARRRRSSSSCIARPSQAKMTGLANPASPLLSPLPRLQTSQADISARSTTDARECSSAAARTAPTHLDDSYDDVPSPFIKAPKPPKRLAAQSTLLPRITGSHTLKPSLASRLLASRLVTQAAEPRPVSVKPI